MSNIPSELNPTAWQQLVLLSKQLAAQSTIADQKTLIEETSGSLFDCTAQLWPAEALQRILDAEGDFHFPPEAPSALMRSSLATQDLTCDEGDFPQRAAAVPLSAGDETLAVLQIERKAGPAFTDADLDLLRGLASLSAIAVHAACQVFIQRWRIDQLSLVRKVSAQAAEFRDPDDLFRRAASLILGTFDFYYVVFFTLDKDSEFLCFRASAGPSDPHTSAAESSPVLQVRLGEGMTGWVARQGEEIVANDVSCEPRYSYEESLPETCSEVALPLKIGDRVLGVLDVQSNEPNDFTETDLLVLRALADNIAVALENAKLFADLRRRAEHLAAVADVSRAVTSNLDAASLFQEVVDLIHDRFGYSFVHLFTIRLDRQQVVFRAGRGPGGRNLESEELVYDLDAIQGIIPWVARNGQVILANDVSLDSRYRPSPLPPANTRSELAVPLIHGGRVLGVLDVQSERANAFDDDDRFLFEALADTTAVAIRNAYLYRSERWRHQVSRSLREVAGLLSADVELDRVLDSILGELENTLPSEAAAIWLLNGDSLCLAAVHGCCEDVSVADPCGVNVGVWLKEALLSSDPMIRDEHSPFDPLGEALGFSPEYSAIAAPLRIGDQLLGLLTLVHSTKGRYGTEARTITAAFASSASVAIQNTRLFESAQQQAWVSTVLLQVADSVQTLSSLTQILDTVVRLTPMLTGFGRCGVMLWDEPTGTFVPAAIYGVSHAQQETFDSWRILPGEVKALDHIRQSKSPVFVEDSDTDAGLSQLQASQVGFKSMGLLPLVTRGEVLGVLLIDCCGRDIPGRNVQAGWSGTEEEAGDEKLVIMRGIAYQAATAIENARLLEMQQVEAYHSAALLQVAQAVTSLNDLDIVLEAITRISPLLLGVKRSLLFVWDADRSQFTLTHAYGLAADQKGFALNRHFSADDFPLLDAIRKCEGLELCPLDDLSAISDRTEHLIPTQLAADLLDWDGVKTSSLHAVSLAVQGEVFGVMLVESDSVATHLKDKWLEIMGGIAQQAALAIQSDWLHRETAGRQALDRELRLAREIQQALIPSEMPQLEGWDLAASWQAAHQVGGDFYDLFELPGNRLGLVMADVADKGVPAALFMALTRTLIRAAVLEDPSPAAALARVNDLLVQDARGGMFVTALYGVLTLDTGQFLYANSGHLPPVVWRSKSGGPERMTKGGMALGVLEGLQLQEQFVNLALGDTLIMYTDGVIDALSPEQQLFGQERLERSAALASGGPAVGTLDKILGDVEQFVGDTPAADDLTLLVLHRPAA